MTVKMLETRISSVRTSHLVTPTNAVASELNGKQAPAFLFPLAVQRLYAPFQDGDQNRRQPEVDLMSAVGRSAGRPLGCASRGSCKPTRHRWSGTGSRSRAAR